MKESIRPYSPSVLTLKAAILPSILVLVESHLPGLLDLQKDDANTSEYISIAKALAVFTIDVLTNFIVSLVQKAECWGSKRKLQKSINDLEQQLPNAKGALKLDLERKIKALRKDLIAITAR